MAHRAKRFDKKEESSIFSALRFALSPLQLGAPHNTILQIDTEIVKKGHLESKI